MKLRPWTRPRLELLFERFDIAGGVVEYAAWDVGPTDVLDLHALHREAARATVAEVSARAAARRGVKDPQALFTFEPGQLVGEEVTVGEFLGPYFDSVSNSLVLPGRSRGARKLRFVAPYDESSEPVEVTRKGSKWHTIGYADAFSDPPYSLEMSSSEINEVFLEIGGVLFGSACRGLRCYSWSTDCSSYFASGRGWWGSHLWTVSGGECPVVGIAATASD